MPGFANNVMYADNVRFDGGDYPGEITADGQLLIGSTAAPNIKVGTLTQPAAGITITNGSGSITFALTNDLAAVEGLATTGVASRTAADTWATSSITNHAVLLGNNTQGITNLGPLTNGQLIIGSTGNDPSAAGLTPGPGISITSGAGSITVAAVGGGLSWSTIGASGALVNNNAYICTAGAALSFSLPATSPVGTVVALTLDGSTSWTITQGAGQRIRFGSLETTNGAGGSLASTAQGDTVYLVCSVADTRFNVVCSVGNITVV